MTSRISIHPEIRFGKPCVRNTGITVGDVLGWLASGMTFEEILFDFEQLTREDILACLMYAAEREQHTTRIPIAACSCCLTKTCRAGWPTGWGASGFVSRHDGCGIGRA